jgi:hypothetical protein
VSGVGTSRASYDKATQYAKANMKTAEEVVAAAKTSSKEIGEKVLHHAEINTKAVFEAAAALARARTLPELARLQTNFVHQQLTVAQAQSQDLFQLSAEVAQHTFATINSAVAKHFKELKKSTKAASVGPGLRIKTLQKVDLVRFWRTWAPPCRRSQLV